MKDELHLNKALKELQDYRAIGSVGDFRTLKELNTPKKLIKWANGTEHCPNCELDNSAIGYGVCIDCGQMLDWSESDE